MRIGCILYAISNKCQQALHSLVVQHCFLAGSGSSALSFSQPTIINGNATMGRFGNTITSLGDVNGDDYQGKSTKITKCKINECAFFNVRFSSCPSVF